MSKVIVGMSMSLDGIASRTTAADFWDVHNAVPGWLFVCERAAPLLAVTSMTVSSPAGEAFL